MYIARWQAIYNLLTGGWPLLHRRSFEALTGHKDDFWLVQAVGTLVLAIGATLLIGDRRRTGRELRLLGVSSALGLAAIDSIYAARRRIPPVYLGDAAIELIIVMAWLRNWRRQRRES
jgi:hypothetical protein